MIEDLYHRRGFAVGEGAVGGRESSRRRRRRRRCRSRCALSSPKGCGRWSTAMTFAGNQAVGGRDAARGTWRCSRARRTCRAQLAVDRDAIQLAYQDLGYESATVDASAAVQPTTARTSPIAFAVREGPQVFVDHVLIVGNVRTSTETIERELQVKPGDPFSLARDQREPAAADGARPVPARADHASCATATRRRAICSSRSKKAPATTVGYGGGVEGRLRVVGDRPSGVRRRDSSRSRRARSSRSAAAICSARTDRSTSSRACQPAPAARRRRPAITEYRVVGTFREPRAVRHRRRCVRERDVRAADAIELQLRAAQRQRRHRPPPHARTSASPAAISFSGRGCSTSGCAAEDQPLIDRLFSAVPAVVVLRRRSSATPATIRSIPSRGEYASANGQLAARAIGSEVGFVKSFFTAQTFRVVPGTNRVVFAGNARLGLATGFPRELSTASDERSRWTTRACRRASASSPAATPRFAASRSIASASRHVPSQPDDTLDERPASDRRQRPGDLQRRAARAGDAAALGVVGFVDTGQRVRDASATSTSASCAARSAAACATSRRSGRSGSTSASRSNRQPGEGLTAWFVSLRTGVLMTMQIADCRLQIAELRDRMLAIASLALDRAARLL